MRRIGHSRIREVHFASAPEGSSQGKVFLPKWIVRVSFTPDLDVPPDWCPAGVVEPYNRWLAVRFLPDTKESPVPSLMMAPVLPLNPVCALGRVFPACPLPKTGEDSVIYFAEGATANNMAMIVGPTSYFGVECKDQLRCCFGQPCAYGFSDVLEKGLHILS